MADGESVQAARIKLATEPSFSLGDILVVPAERRITSDTLSEIIEPRIMQVFVALARADGGIVSRDALIETCWDGRIVGDNAIHRAISKIRELGLKFGDRPFKVETIAKVGYRMIRADGTALPPLAPTDTDPVASAWRSRRWVLGAGLAGIGCIAAGAAYTLSRAGPEDRHIDALVTQARQAMRSGLPDSNAQGAGFLEEAVTLQPRNAYAWGRLALSRALMAEYAPSESVTAIVAGTQEAARRALALDPRQADAHAALALLPPYYGEWHAAERRMEEVLALDPEHLETRDARAFMLVAVGRMAEGSRDRLVLARREPLHALHQFRLIYAHWLLGEIAQADRAAERALQLWPNHPGAWFGRLWTLAFTGRADRARAHIEQSARTIGMSPTMVEALHLSMTALASARPADIGRAADAVLGLVAASPSASINAVMILAGLGEIDHAFAVTDAYLLERGPLLSSLRWQPGEMSVNDQRRRKTNMLFVPATQAMRADPRFSRLSDEIGLTDYWQQANITPDHLSRNQ